jgi:hypothetical protein
MVLHMNSLAAPPITNDILLITWGQTMDQEVLKFLMVINLKKNWP